mmetsp:Transcript_14242/g.33254  ORF Transcript_14242/g.33254 Transcript_14242/m.33254 type:complete len:316 (-) Transcript_14242:52-999(-)
MAVDRVDTANQNTLELELGGLQRLLQHCGLGARELRLRRLLGFRCLGLLFLLLGLLLLLGSLLCLSLLLLLLLRRPLLLLCGGLPGGFHRSLVLRVLVIIVIAAIVVGAHQCREATSGGLLHNNRCVIVVVIRILVFATLFATLGRGLLGFCVPALWYLLLTIIGLLIGLLVVLFALFACFRSGLDLLLRLRICSRGGNRRVVFLLILCLAALLLVFLAALLGSGSGGRLRLIVESHVSRIFLHAAALLATFRRRLGLRSAGGALIVEVLIITVPEIVLLSLLVLLTHLDLLVVCEFYGKCACCVEIAWHATQAM